MLSKGAVKTPRGSLHRQISLSSRLVGVASAVMLTTLQSLAVGASNRAAVAGGRSSFSNPNMGIRLAIEAPPTLRMTGERDFPLAGAFQISIWNAGRRTVVLNGTRLLRVLIYDRHGRLLTDFVKYFYRPGAKMATPGLYSLFILGPGEILRIPTEAQAISPGDLAPGTYQAKAVVLAREGFIPDVTSLLGHYHLRFWGPGRLDSPRITVTIPGDSIRAAPPPAVYGQPRYSAAVHGIALGVEYSSIEKNFSQPVKLTILIHNTGDKTVVLGANHTLRIEGYGASRRAMLLGARAPGPGGFAGLRILDPGETLEETITLRHSSPAKLPHGSFYVKAVLSGSRQVPKDIASAIRRDGLTVWSGRVVSPAIAIKD